ncbi:transcriptional regulator [bacterium]|nr:transcriptional regulator [bacterium]
MAKSALLIKTIELIKQQPGITINGLARQLGRSERTIYRWLSELAVELATPVYCSDGGYYLNDLCGDDTLDLDAEEILALKLSLKSSPFGQTSPIGKYAQSAWKKIRNAVSYDGLVAARDMAEAHSVHVNAPPCDVSSDILDKIENGLNKHHRLHVIYSSQKSNADKEYVIDPYAIVFRRHSWYVIAASREHGKVRQFKLARFLRVVETNECFEVPQEFDVDDYFRLSWEAWAGGEPTVVKVRFSPRVARIIMESRRHPTQVVKPRPDGSVIFEVCVAGIEEIAIWIMGYGRDAQVLEPHSLRKYIYEHAKAMCALYSDAEKKVEQFVGGLT